LINIIKTIPFFSISFANRCWLLVFLHWYQYQTPPLSFSYRSGPEFALNFSALHEVSFCRIVIWTVGGILQYCSQDGKLPASKIIISKMAAFTDPCMAPCKGPPFEWYLGLFSRKPCKNPILAFAFQPCRKFRIDIDHEIHPS
jgi:hypothetical protein